MEEAKEDKEEDEEKEKPVDIFQCPRCHSKFGYTNKNNVRVCRQCGNRYSIKW